MAADRFAMAAGFRPGAGASLKGIDRELLDRAANIERERADRVNRKEREKEEKAKQKVLL